MPKTKKSKSSAEPITHIPILKSTKPIPDGTFIETKDKHDGYAAINTPRYGEEIDVDDM